MNTPRFKSIEDLTNTVNGTPAARKNAGAQRMSSKYTTNNADSNINKQASLNESSYDSRAELYKRMSSNSGVRKTNREYLLSEETASELNTYRNFGIFPVFNDAYAPKYDKNNNYKEDFDGKYVGSPGVRSIFNRYAAQMVGSSTGVVSLDDIASGVSEWRAGNNVPLLDSPNTRKKIRSNSGCTIKELVDASSQGMLGRNVYAYSDFMYCKYLGRIPNNMLITLRRFPIPVGDYISSTGIETRKKIHSNDMDSIGCMVTWMGTPGNDLNAILKYDVGMNWDEKTAGYEEGGADADAQRGFFNQVASVFDQRYREQYMAGTTGSQVEDTINSLWKHVPVVGNALSGGSAPYNARDLENWRDSNKVYGPIDVVMKTKVRQQGLEFNQKFSLTFDYELRSYNGINGRTAMLDLLSNILAVTYSTGSWWGGAYKSSGAHQNNIFTNMEIFSNKNKSAADFFDSFSNDISTATQSISDKINAAGGFKEIALNVLNQLGGMLIGNLLNKAGRPAKMMVNSLLSEAPVGLWHLTIGNPFHPIMSVGNLALSTANIEHYGPLGLDDFPTGLKVTVELERCKPRDLREIEKIYMNGNDRIYSPMGPKLLNMYNQAIEYKSNKSIKQGTYSRGEASVTNNAGIQVNPNNTSDKNTHSSNSLKESSNIYMKYFGTANTYGPLYAAQDIEFGANPKKKANK